ncbi:MAG: glycosyltransferase family 2 protein [Prevotella sp.]|uniref:glycosyltransferase family 2 protein n=1 Tax=Prevotella sp. TaxID=59823 RepID=UPI002A2CFC57|nr:glycosyltransferase family 2 protein [Prevotella sp.]MDD7318899.1 glycosyltransferase family 2 protein [Prevotellaceae bacterium]MDY4019278.1 glycosyltransferase family 2 protein [Prevotella sp.]
MDKVAIVILNWNGEEMLRKFLPSVIENSGQATVYVADNASSDGSLELLRVHFPKIKIITLDRNWGFADGYNKALKEVEAEYYILMNSDIEVTQQWLAPLIDFMDSHGDVAACQPKLLSESARDCFEYAGASGGFIDYYGYPFCRGRIFDVVEKDDGQYDDPCEIFWATGACLMIRSEDYWRAGGLDGRFFAHNEEIDLCWRLRLQGRKIYCIPQSRVFHVGGGTLPKGNSRKTFLNFRNNLTMLYKNLPERELRHVMFVRWVLDYVAAWQTLLLGGNVGDFKAIYKARRSFRKWKNDFAEDRRKIQSAAVSHDIPERRKFSILWQYYVKRSKHFSALRE